MEVGCRYKGQQAGNGRGSNPCSLILARDRAGDRQALVLAEPLISEEKENFVLEDRAAKIGAEIIALERGLRTPSNGVEKIPRVQIVVAEKLEQFAVVFVGAGTRGEIHDRAGVSSVLRGKR